MDEVSGDNEVLVDTRDRVEDVFEDLEVLLLQVENLYFIREGFLSFGCLLFTNTLQIDRLRHLKIFTKPLKRNVLLGLPQLLILLFSIII